MECVLDTATVAAFQRVGVFDRLRDAAAPPFVIVDAVCLELTRGEGAPQQAIREAIEAGWLRVEPLPAAVFAARIHSLMNDRKLGRTVDLGEAASIAFCAEHPDTLFVTPDCGGLFAAFKHLYGLQTRAWSFQSFVRFLVETRGLPAKNVRALVNYADSGRSLEPIWWGDWTASLPTL